MFIWANENIWIGSISPSCKEKLLSLSVHFQNCYVNTEEILVKLNLFQDDQFVRSRFLNKFSYKLRKSRNTPAVNHNPEEKNV